MLVKMFVSNNQHQLENEINKWLHANDVIVEFVQQTFIPSYNHHADEMTVSIWYKPNL